MAIEIQKDTLGLGSPQGSRKLGMGSDLLSVPEFAEVIDQVDRLLGLRSGGSLNPELQTASVTYSVAVHRALQQLTGKTPGLWTAPSIGENTIAAMTGAIDLDLLIPALAIRQNATQAPLTEGFKTMAAIRGVDVKPFLSTLEAISTSLGKRLEAFKISNFNSPQKFVVAMNLTGGLTVGEVMALVQDRLPKVKIRTLDDITHAYHTEMIRLEQAVFEQEVKFTYGEDFFKDPNPDMKWFSPMQEQEIVGKDQVKELFFHQLTETVHFDRAIHRILIDDEVNTVLGTDVTGVALNMARDNFPKQIRRQVRFLNVKDRPTFDQVATQLAA